MWHILVLNSVICFHPTIVISAWVEIPQIPSDSKPAQFILGAPKVSFVEQKLTTTTPANHKMATTTPRLPPTTLANYKKIMSTTTSPLTTTSRQNQKRREDKVESTINAPKWASEEEKKTTKTKNKTTKNEEVSGFLPLLHSIQETLTLSAKKSLKSKISLLANLRDNLLLNIDDRMSSLWKRSSDSTNARGHDDQEMDFPSNEGALMTIGFLTFAVFLIKLVLKLIHALKNKSTSVTTTTTDMAGTAATTFIGRKKRDLGHFDSLKILQFIDEYKFK